MIRSHLVLGAVLLGMLAPLWCGRGAEASDRRNRKSIERYVVPDVVLTNQDGTKVHLKSLLRTGKPVMLDFIYCSCTTTCPVLSSDYANVQSRLGPDTQRVQLLSISIDPVNDTPRVMKAYLKNYRAKPGWDFLTGSVGEIGKVLKSFGVKEMSYNYFTLIRTAADGTWTKINGHVNATEVVNDYLK